MDVATLLNGMMLMLLLLLLITAEPMQPGVINHRCGTSVNLSDEIFFFPSLPAHCWRK